MPKYPKSLIQDISDLWAKYLELEKKIEKLEENLDIYSNLIFEHFKVLDKRVSKLEKVVKNDHKQESSKR